MSRNNATAYPYRGVSGRDTPNQIDEYYDRQVRENDAWLAGQLADPVHDDDVQQRHDRTQVTLNNSRSQEHMAHNDAAEGVRPPPPRGSGGPGGGTKNVEPKKPDPPPVCTSKLVSFGKLFSSFLSVLHCLKAFLRFLNALSRSAKNA